MLASCNRTTLVLFDDPLTRPTCCVRWRIRNETETKASDPGGQDQPRGHDEEVRERRQIGEKRGRAPADDISYLGMRRSYQIFVGAGLMGA